MEWVCWRPSRWYPFKEDRRNAIAHLWELGLIEADETATHYRLKVTLEIDSLLFAYHLPVRGVSGDRRAMDLELPPGLRRKKPTDFGVKDGQPYDYEKRVRRTKAEMIEAKKMKFSTSK